MLSGNFEGLKIWLQIFGRFIFGPGIFWGFDFFNLSIVPTTWKLRVPPPPPPPRGKYTTEDRKQLYLLQNAIVGKLLPTREWIKTEEKHLNNPAKT